MRSYKLLYVNFTEIFESIQATSSPLLIRKGRPVVLLALGEGR
jgi:hypothetical protein